MLQNCQSTGDSDDQNCTNAISPAWKNYKNWIYNCSHSSCLKQNFILTFKSPSKINMICIIRSLTTILKSLKIFYKSSEFTYNFEKRNYETCFLTSKEDYLFYDSLQMEVKSVYHTISNPGFNKINIFSYLGWR